MPVANVKSRWVGGDLYFYDKAGAEILHFDATNRKLVIPSGSVLDVAGTIATAGTQGAALTVQLTTVTHTAPGTPDYAVQALTQTTPFGFVTSDEGHSVLAVIANLQTRLAEVEARLEAIGLVAAN